MPISTSDLAGLPDLHGFRRLTKSLAALDAVLSPEWEDRYYSFNAAWDKDKREMWASMRNGSGDQWVAILCPVGAALLGLAHEAQTFEAGQPKPWLFADLPPAFHANLMNEAAADAANSTFCIWRARADTEWHCGLAHGPQVDDGSAALLSILDGDPSRYVRFADEYYEAELELADVRAVYAHEPITDELAERLNTEVDLEQLRTDLEEIGCPDREAAPQS